MGRRTSQALAVLTEGARVAADPEGVERERLTASGDRCALRILHVFSSPYGNAGSVDSHSSVSASRRAASLSSPLERS